jgi:hypothetical protein
MSSMSLIVSNLDTVDFALAPALVSPEFPEHVGIKHRSSATMHNTTGL